MSKRAISLRFVGRVERIDSENAFVSLVRDSENERYEATFGRSMFDERGIGEGDYFTYHVEASDPAGYTELRRLPKNSLSEEDAKRINERIKEALG